ncbi:SMI1/KNR4 family protein [Streptomyces sp. NBC_00433]
MSSLHDFTTWEPLLRVLRADNADALAAPGGQVAGQIGRGGWSLPTRPRRPRPGQALQVGDMPEFDAVEPIRAALAEDGTDHVSFTVGISPDGSAVLDVFWPSPAVEPGIGNAYPGSMTLVEGALPEPWRRLPVPVPGATPAASADPALLERTLRARIPEAVGATDAEMADAEKRLGVALPAELAALYRVTRARWQDRAGHEAAEAFADAVGCELFPLDGLYVADASSRPSRWEFAAMEAAVTAPDAAVQALAGSPGWIAFGDNGGGDRLAVDLTPGPGGHIGQVVVIPHEDNLGACLLADSLTDLVVNLPTAWGSGTDAHGAPAVARVNAGSLRSVEAAVHPDLEVLSVGVWDDAPVSLAPVVGLPRLRTLAAYPGTLADPLEIAALTGLEFLELGPEDWRVLLDAGAVPRSLSAASVEVHGGRPLLPVVDLVNEILALWDRPPIPRTTLTGGLGPLA